MSTRRDLPRGFEFALFVTSLLWAGAAWAVAGRAAHGIAGRFGLDALETLLGGAFLIFLVVLGYQLLDWISVKGGALRDAAPLPRRAGFGTEWGVGAAIGWGLALAAVLPLLITGNLHGRWALGGDVLGVKVASMVISTTTLAVVCLAEELIARGWGFQRLAGAVGASWAAVLSSLGFAAALVYAGEPRSVGTAMVVGTLFGLVLAMAYLRTYALWVGWGIHFGFRVVMAVVLGLPVAGHGELRSVLDAYPSGPHWLTGGSYGLDAAVLTAVVMLGGMAVVYRATRDWAWAYTAPEIVGAGYEVVVAPPAAHVAMEKSASAAPPPLVQILPTTSQSRSAGEIPPQ